MTEEEALARASDPATPAAELATIAHTFATTHSLIAQHPNVYPDLVTWITAHGGPSGPAQVGGTAAAPPREAATPAHAGSGLTGATFRGLLTIAAGAGVFILCSIIQGMGGSSMFSTTYSEPDNLVVDLLINLTFYPGWLMTVALISAGVAQLAAAVSSGDTQDRANPAAATPPAIAHVGQTAGIATTTPVEQPTAPDTAPTTAHSFAALPPADMVRDAAAALLLILALPYAWRWGNAGASTWYVLISTILAFAGIAFGHLTRLGALGDTWNHRINRPIRLAAAVPYLLSILSILVADATNGGFDYEAYSSSIGPGALLGTVAIVLTIQPRQHETDPHRRTSEDAVWLGAAIGLGAAAALSALGTGTASAIGAASYSGSAAAATAIWTVAVVGALSIVVTGLAQRDAGWFNILVGLAGFMVIIDIVHFDTWAFAATLGITTTPYGESIHHGPSGAIFLAAAGAAACAPGIARTIGARLSTETLRLTAGRSLQLVAIWALLRILLDVADLMLGGYVAPAIASLMLSLVVAVLAVAAFLAWSSSGSIALGLVTACAVALSGTTVSIVNRISDSYYPASWFSTALLACAVALLLTYTSGDFSVLHRWLARSTTYASVGPDPVIQAASDPTTPQAQLATIAHQHSHARAIVAANPQAYPALLDWLAALDDPEINAALASRRS